MNLVNVGSQPELKEKVLSGEYFIRTSADGQVALSAEETLYHDPSEKIMLWLNPSQEALEGAAAIVGSVQGYTFRIVRSVGELIEKIKVRDAGLDDVVMELCKYATKLDMQDSMKSNPNLDKILSAGFRFYKMDGSDGEVQFAYALDGSMEMLAVPLSMYENARSIVSRNPVFQERSTGFVQIDDEWLGAIIR